MSMRSIAGVGLLSGSQCRCCDVMLAGDGMRMYHELSHYMFLV
jgi:hypothetical protein